MKFATLTLKEGEGNGGAYYLLFSNRPPSDKALPASDCSAGVSIRYGTKPKSKVRNSGEFAPTWSGTTWKAGQEVLSDLLCSAAMRLRHFRCRRCTSELTCGSSSAARTPSAWKRLQRLLPKLQMLQTLF